MADEISDIKARLDIVDIVSQYVKLKKAGVNYKGLCPFHSEKSPSFIVSPEKQICHCFSCEKGGDIFTFIQEIESLDFASALEILAEKAGIKIEKANKEIVEKNKTKKQNYYKAHEIASTFFQKQLNTTTPGKKVLEYLKQRGLTKETIKKFKIGYAPNKINSLTKILQENNIPKEIIEKSGFSNKNNNDKFRDRLMIPIFNYLGKICGFGGRALQKDQLPKYLNSPQNEIYDKSNILYGLYNAKQEIKEKGEVILVEGYFDVLLPHQSGIKNIVAVSGTALTTQQVKILKRLTQTATTCFDSDSAGQKATERSYQKLAEQDFTIKTISAKEKDPADIITSNGPQAFKNLIAQGEDFITYKIKQETKKNETTTIEGQRKVIKKILPLIKSTSETQKDIHIRHLAKSLKISEKAIYDEINKLKLPNSHPSKTNTEKTQTTSNNSLQKQILSIIISTPTIFHKVESEIEKITLIESIRNIYNELKNQYNYARNDLKNWNFEKGELNTNKEKLKKLSLYAEETYKHLSQENKAEEIKELINKIKKKEKEDTIKKLQLEIQAAEESGNKEKLLILLQKQHTLLLNK